MADDEQRRLERFERLRPPPFSGAESEDAQDFLDKCQRMLRIIGILETSGVLFTTFQFSGAAFRWWEQFSDLFLEKFVPQSCREELHRQFEQLCQGNMFVTQYEMIYSELARHAIWLIPTDRENIRRFIDGLTFQLRLLMTKERMSGATFDEVVDIALRKLLEANKLVGSNFDDWYRNLRIVLMHEKLIDVIDKPAKIIPPENDDQGTKVYQKLLEEFGSHVNHVIDLTEELEKLEYKLGKEIFEDLILQPVYNVERFHCNKKRHWKRNCKEYLATLKDKKQGETLMKNIFKVSLATNQFL
ncbi:uncharacterized protein [Nicotiana tomentosiformis]|uniref:uncharacterized protein n=1 Tax=Nicotiana tomentosiformis TaxID=4098 RepID=UPI00388CDD9D